MLVRSWEFLPPPAMQLQAIGQVLGIKPPRRRGPTAPEDAMAEARRAGLPVSMGRPDDPMLDLVGL